MSKKTFDGWIPVRVEVGSMGDLTSLEVFTHAGAVTKAPLSREGGAPEKIAARLAEVVGALCEPVACPSCGNLGDSMGCVTCNGTGAIMEPVSTRQINST